jgi:hypothetical protein
MVAGCDRYMQICKLLPRRGPAGRPPGRVHADRSGDELRRPRGRDGDDGPASCATLEGDRRRTMCGPCSTMTYREAMERFGIDRPDTRYGLEIKDVSDIAAKTDVGFFKDVARQGADRPKLQHASRRREGDPRPRRRGEAHAQDDRRLQRVRRDPSARAACAVVKVSAQGAFETGIAKFLEPVKADSVRGPWPPARRHGPLRRRHVQRRDQGARRAPPEGRPRHGHRPQARGRGRPLELPLGRRLPHVRARQGPGAGSRCTIPSPAPTTTSCRGVRQCRRQR